MLKKIPFNERPMRLAFSHLESLITALGWHAEPFDDDNFPYNTYYWVVIPVTDSHINSDEMKKFLYACGYYDLDIDYENKKIHVNI